MRAVTRAIVLWSVLSLGCREAQEPVAPAAPVQSPDYAVYDAVLESLFGGDGTGAPARYVLSDSTMIGDDLSNASTGAYLRREVGPSLGSMLDATRDAYVARSKVRVPLDERAFRTQVQIELASRRTLDSLTRKGRNPGSYWSAFYARFPGSKGVIAFSLPGYDRAGTHALLSYAHGCGALCGDWGFVLLERRNGRWVILKRVVTAVS